MPVALLVKDRAKPSGHASICRPCEREKSRAYYQANRERKLASVKKWQARNRKKAVGAPRSCRMCGGEATSSKHWYCDGCRLARKRHKDREREKRRVRATSQERGYGSAHQKLRRRVAKVVDAGRAQCARCGLPIIPGEPWDLGHDDDDRSLYSGPEHRACNRRTATHKKQRRVASRRW